MPIVPSVLWDTRTWREPNYRKELHNLSLASGACIGTADVFVLPAAYTELEGGLSPAEGVTTISVFLRCQTEIFAKHHLGLFTPKYKKMTGETSPRTTDR
ncbi:hypothetical protein UPYG_G00292180 [Umbra pygmaea]|uniref:Uncharacterized protein n=1 Tax=Umbra pygmaea TaxID=75934 RepID=A0ABD0W502_UMBPY